jgi:hypothetical protein
MGKVTRRGLLIGGVAAYWRKLFDRSTSRQENNSFNGNRFPLDNTIALGAGAYAVLIQAPATYAGQSLLERAPVEP